MKAKEQKKERVNVYQMVTDGQVSQDIAEKYFPELKESDEERMKDVAIEFVKQNKSFNYRLGISKEEVIAWLEKQSEQREQLINKACNVLVDCIEDFMLRRMEVWSEECKKQTLENIRKTLEE